MNLNEYQKKANETAIYAPKWVVVYPALGLASEAGEVAGKVKKFIRDDRGKFTDARRFQIRDELGDVLWYLTALAGDLGFDLEDIAKRNLHKLEKRQAENKIKGDGDNR
jgi:NTP pyrophosphatase (non-canonical NTP hydrolase)